MIIYARYLLSFLFCALVITLLAQTKEYSNLKLTTQPLTQGGTAKLSYDPVSEIKGLLPKEPLFAIIQFYTEGKAFATEVEMQPSKNGLWTANLTIPNNADVALINFLCGTFTDNNNSNGYFFSIYNSKGIIPVGNAASLSQIYSAAYQTGLQNRQPELARKYALKYLQDAGETLSLPTKADWLLNAEDTAALCDLLRKAGGAAITETEYYNLAYYAKQVCKNKELENEINEKHRLAHPMGTWRLHTWADSINRAPNVVAMYAWHNAFKLAFGNEDTIARKYLLNFLPNIMYYAAQRCEVTLFKALDQDPDIAKLNVSMVANYYYMLSNQCLKKDTLHTDAMAYAQKAMSSITALYDSKATKADFQSEKVYRLSLDRIMSNYEGTYGQWLLKENKYDSALYFLDRAASLKNWKDETLNEALARGLLQYNQPQKAVAVLENAIAADAFTSSLKSVYLEAAAKTQVANPEAKLNLLEKAALETKTAYLRKKMISQPAPMFVLKDMDGREISLAALKGKVVVVDFWATWCGPCIASFPGMQQVVDLHKLNPDVVLLFVNSWEKGDDKQGNVRKFMANKPYTFQVLFDLEDNVIKQYDVAGIPTKFIIDKQGNIAFKSVGYNGNIEKTFTEMQLMLKLAASR